METNLSMMYSNHCMEIPQQLTVYTLISVWWESPETHWLICFPTCYLHSAHIMCPYFRRFSWESWTIPKKTVSRKTQYQQVTGNTGTDQWPGTWKYEMSILWSWCRSESIFTPKKLWCKLARLWKRKFVLQTSIFGVFSSVFAGCRLYTSIFFRGFIKMCLLFICHSHKIAKENCEQIHGHFPSHDYACVIICVTCSFTRNRFWIAFLVTAGLCRRSQHHLGSDVQSRIFCSTFRTRCGSSILAKNVFPINIWKMFLDIGRVLWSYCFVCPVFVLGKIPLDVLQAPHKSIVALGHRICLEWAPWC